jgi:hypothetical protein
MGVTGVMATSSIEVSRLRTVAVALLALGACALMPTAPAVAGGTTAGTGSAGTGTTTPGATTKSVDTASLVECVTTGEESERAATFAGEMTALPGTAKMQMRIDVLERLPRELVFHTVAAPGLGVWRSSAAGVKVYKDLKEVTNLSGPASYRAEVRFRWLNAKGKLIKGAEARTQRCTQPALTVTPPSEEASVVVNGID